MDNETTSIDVLSQALATKNAEIANIETEISKKISVFTNQLTVLREEDIQLRAMLKDAMEQKAIKKYENDYIQITYIAPTTRKTLDSTKLKIDLPELYEKYTKTSDVKSSIRIKILEGDK